VLLELCQVGIAEVEHVSDWLPIPGQNCSDWAAKRTEIDTLRVMIRCSFEVRDSNATSVP
jgi:hypothetical protein